MIPAGEGAELGRAVAAAKPGDTIVLGVGAWRDQELVLTGQGSRNKPILIRAERPGEVIFSGRSSLVLKGRDLILEGLLFEKGFIDRGSVILLDGDRLRLKETVIDGYNPPEPQTSYAWVSLKGRNHEVERCTFRDKRHAGVTLDVVRFAGSPDHHYIRGCYFVGRSTGTGEEDGWATIRIGSGALAHSSSYTVIERNLFEACDGGNELISNRAGGNTFRHNTFRRCRGAVSLRHGQASLVEANFFLGESLAVAGAVKIFGSGHVVINNYIEAVGSWENAAISLGAGAPRAPLGGYGAAEGAVIAFNTIVDSPGPFIDLAAGLGAKGRSEAPSNVTIANNLLYADTYSEGAFLAGEPGAGLTMEGNLVYGRENAEGFGEEVLVEDPLLARADGGILRPTEESPALAAAEGSYRMVVQDVDEQRRPAMKDIGCDEVVEGSARNHPLTAAEVGATWYRATDSAL